MVIALERGFVLARIEENPDITLRGLQAELAERGAGHPLRAREFPPLH
jgi:hypothetical protein